MWGLVLVLIGKVYFDIERASMDVKNWAGRDIVFDEPFEWRNILSRLYTISQQQ